MNAFNLLVIIVVGVAAVLGFRKGIIAQAGQIAALVAGVVACRMFGTEAAHWIGAAGDKAPSTGDTVLGYAAVFLVFYFGVLLIAHLVRGVVHGVHLGILDRGAGAMFKVCLWTLLLSVALNIWAVVTPDSDLTDTKAHPGRAYVLKIAPEVCGYIRTHSHENPQAE